MLAARVIQEQGILVEGLNFYTGFCVEGHTHAIRSKDQAKPKRNNALWSAEQLGIKLHIVDIVEEYKDIVINPKHGYGKYLNPCLDCKVFMVQKAMEWMLEKDFDFIITGEVVGQRPKSQRKETMPLVAKKSGADDRLLRPLCAKRLEPTLPEREGWVDREQLHDITGRSRKSQFALAEKYGFKDYAQPAGGCCFLTNEAYSEKLSDLWQFRGERRYEIDDIMLLKIGRHIRPKSHFKIIIGREEGENNFMQGYKRQFTHLYSSSHTGPLALIDGELKDQDDRELAARIIGRYGKSSETDDVTVNIVELNGVQHEMTVKPFSVTEVPGEWHVGIQK